MKVLPVISKEWEEIGVPEDWAYVLRKAGFNLISDIREEKAKGFLEVILDKLLLIL